MSVADTRPVEFEQCDYDRSAAERCVYGLWGLRPGVSSPRRSPVSEHCPVGWLYGVWGFDV